MKALFIFLSILLGGAALGVLIVNDPGYVLLTYQEYSLETPLWFALFSVILLFVILNYTLRFLNFLWQVPNTVRQLYQERRKTQDRKRCWQAFLALSECRWQHAERLLLRTVKYAEEPMFHYLGAAVAANHNQNPQKRDEYLLKAHQCNKQADVAIGLTQAKLQMQSGQFEQALATLTHLRQKEPKHRYLLLLLKKVYLEVKDYKGLLAILPLLKKREVLDNPTLNQLAAIAHADVIANIPDLKKLQKHWRKIPNDVINAELVGKMAGRLVYFKAIQQAESLLKQFLTQNLNDKLLSLYANLPNIEKETLLQQATLWHKNHPQHAHLNFILGKLSYECKLWGQAERFLKASIAINPSASAYSLLKDLH